MNAESDLRRQLRLVVLTDPRPAAGDLVNVVAECLEAGCRAIQLRDKECQVRDLYEQAVVLRDLTRDFGALLLVNDRLDAALAAGADGVHLGPDDIRVGPARSFAPRPFLIGYSTDDPELGRRAAAEGADYLGVGAVFGTASKPGLENEAIGPARVGQVLRVSGLPCVGIGGITAANVASVASQGAGAAVLGSVMHAERPGEAVRDLLSAIAAATAGNAPSQ